MLTKVVNGVTFELSPEQEELIRAEWGREELKMSKTDYMRKRKAEYPAIPEQLDIIFHEGIDAWKERIKAIKDKYPKPAE